jgi:hypothetical protein
MKKDTTMTVDMDVTIVMTYVAMMNQSFTSSMTCQLGLKSIDRCQDGLFVEDPRHR